MDLLKTGLLDGNPLEVQGTTFETFPLAPLLIVPEVITPSLELNFATGKQLDSRITFTRGSTGTFINSSGLVETAGSGVARFTHDPVTLASLGLLIEESRTNLLLRSEEFDNASWTKGFSSISTNSTTAPDGASTADTLVENTQNNEHYCSQSVTKAASAIQYTASVWFKAASGSRNLGLGITDGATGGLYSVFSTSGAIIQTAQTIGSSSGWIAGATTITAHPNGWYRATFTATTNTAARVDTVCYIVSGTNRIYTGDGTSGILLWGAQLEAGAFATSYIPTTSATVTRAADVATMTGTNFSSWFNATEGTLVADYASTGTTASKFFQLSALDGGSNNSGLGLIDSNVRAGNVYIPSFSIQASFSTTLPASGGKAALAYKTNDFAASFAGGAVSTDTSGSLPTPAVLYIGNGPVTGQQAAGTISRIRYYRRRLPNANLQTLTT